MHIYPLTDPSFLYNENNEVCLTLENSMLKCELRVNTVLKTRMEETKSQKKLLWGYRRGHSGDLELNYADKLHCVRDCVK